jgi:ferric-dicitrate binding protein FerR (iron transport regulator)
MSNNYAGVEDLLCDESFLLWYFRTDAAAIRQWELWISVDPGNKARAEQAVEFLRSLHLDEKDIPSGQITQAESLLLEKIRQVEYRVTTGKKISMSPRRWWMAAASVILVIAGSYSIYQVLTKRPELHTAYGEVRENRLPDGTDVVVNADSKLIYSTGWKDGKDREVWLKGEAFFHVTKTPLKSRFIVHTDHFDIIVTGTQFNVVNRQGKANIMLREGSVTLHTEEGKELKMLPGDFVEYHSTQLEKKQVKNDSLLAWKEHRLIFDNTPVHELVPIIREHYGITVQPTGDHTRDKTISGILPNDNLEVLLQALEATGDYKVVKEGDSIQIQIRQ